MRIYPVLLLLIPVYLGGCGVDSTDPKPPQTSTTLFSFDVAGTVPPDTVTDPERIVVPLQANNDTVAGDFNLMWDVDSSDPYYVQVYVSSDQVVSADDDLFLDTPCGTQYDQYCDFLTDLTCYFVYEPDYNYIPAQDADGNPITIREKNPDGSFVVLADHFYLRCPTGPPTIWEKEITSRLNTVGYNTIQYMILTACNTDADAPDCQQSQVVPFVFLDSMP